MDDRNEWKDVGKEAKIFMGCCAVNDDDDDDNVLM